MIAAPSEVLTVGVDGDALRATVTAMDRALHDLGQPLTSVALAVELVCLEADKTTRQDMLMAARMGMCTSNARRGRTASSNGKPAPLG